jgi:tRNA (cmo5U34)-methyltransferase
MEEIKKYKAYYEIYDKVVLKMMPFYPEMHEEMIRLISRKLQDKMDILEPGFGTGTLTYLIFKKFPNAKLIGIDNSNENIEKAKQKLKNFQGFSYRLEDMKSVDLGQKFDIVISALAIHHLSGEEKRHYFANVYKILKLKGRLIIGDIVKSTDEESWHQYLIKAMGSEGEYRWQRHKNNPDDKLSSIDDQLKWLKKSGFTKVEITKKWFNFYVFYGEK